MGPTLKLRNFASLVQVFISPLKGFFKLLFSVTGYHKEVVNCTQPFLPLVSVSWNGLYNSTTYM
jgi:hypothetical protein